MTASTAASDGQHTTLKILRAALGCYEQVGLLLESTRPKGGGGRSWRRSRRRRRRRRSRRRWRRRQSGFSQRKRISHLSKEGSEEPEGKLRDLNLNKSYRSTG